MTEVWRLVRREELLGEVVVEERDFPWLRGRFLAQPGFAEVKPLFDEELALLEADVAEGWDEAYSLVEAAVRLVAPNGGRPEFLLHIEGERAWFRWRDSD
ncbi:hypothetical protein JOF53_007624 [Crossiella equi]|uniref:Uncharacterized protein n=1 Tax=Crossiella equi TaxID=130796 RepID=A0ABS5AQS8_9PSEU|nr:hypothetical protein [Crossiella equi]MBP2478752.1 hypothetical protein [Crossiella equi]